MRKPNNELIFRFLACFLLSVFLAFPSGLFAYVPTSLDASAPGPFAGPEALTADAFGAITSGLEAGWTAFKCSIFSFSSCQTVSSTTAAVAPAVTNSVPQNFSAENIPVASDQQINLAANVSPQNSSAQTSAPAAVSNPVSVSAQARVVQSGVTVAQVNALITQALSNLKLTQQPVAASTSSAPVYVIESSGSSYEPSADSAAQTAGMAITQASEQLSPQQNAQVSSLIASGTAVQNGSVITNGTFSGSLTGPEITLLSTNPATTTNVLYQNSGVLYWDGAPVGGGGSGVWGGIVGSIANQTDLQNEFSQQLSLAAWAATTTDALAEGTNHLYFTNARATAAANAAISATTSLPNITTLTGLTSAPNLALNASNISMGTVSVARGGTGTTSAAGLNQLLIGNGAGGYNFVSTSSLGISGGGTGTGTVASVGLSLPNIFNVSGSPITSSGTLTATLASQTGNQFLASPNGSSGTPTFRSIVAADIPILNQNTTGTAGNVTGIVAIANGGTGTSTSPSVGQLLIGNASGGFNYISTSSLGFIAGTNYFTNSAATTSLNTGSILAAGAGTFGIVNATSTTGTSTFANVSANNASVNNASISNLAVGNLNGILFGTNGVVSSISTSSLDIPSTASTTQWNNFYNNPSSQITAGTGLSWSGNTLNATISSGTVTAVGLSLPNIFNVSGSSVTASGTLTATFANESANEILASPNGSSGTPTFRALVAADIPTLNQNTTGTAGNVTGVVAIANGGTGTSTAPTVGELLIGNAAGGYSYVSTSSLGFVAGTNYFTNSSATTSLNTGSILTAAVGTFGTVNATSTTGTSTLGNASVSNLAVSGNASVNGTTTLNGLKLNNIANTVLAVDANGNVIATTTSSGGVTAVNASGGLQSSGGTTPTISPASGYSIPLTASTSQFANLVNASATLPYYIAAGSTTVSSIVSLPNLSLAFSQITGLASVSQGGTGSSSYAAGSILLGSSTNPLYQLLPGSNGTVLSVVGGVPTYVSTSSLGFIAGTNYFTNSSATTSLNTGSILTAAVGTFGTINATSTTGTSTFANAANFGGHVGIGTTTPNSLLTVAGSAQITGTTTVGGLQVGSLSGLLFGTAGNVSAVSTSSLGITGTNYLTNSSATTSLNTGSILAAGVGTFGTVNATSTTGTSTLGNASANNVAAGSLKVGTLSGILFGTSGNVSAISTSSLGLGTVSSVGLSLPNIFNVSGSPVVASGTLTATLASESANEILASPNGSSGTPTFRALVAADIPTLNQNTTGTAGNVTGVVAIANGGTGTSSAPTVGELLIGNAAGGFSYVSTSSLGIAGGGANFFTNSSATTSLNTGSILAAGTGTFGAINATSTTGTSTFSGNVVFGSSTAPVALSVSSAGNVGVGTSTPGTLFTVAGNALVTATSTLDGLQLPNLTNTVLAVDANGNVIATTTGGGTNYFSNSGATTTLSTGSVLSTGELAVTGTATSTFNGDISITGNIVPTANQVYSLGSVNDAWENLYVGPGSIYVNGQEVLHTDPSQNVNVTASTNQSLILSTAGTGNIEFNPSGSGQILVQGNVLMSAGDHFTSTNAGPIGFVGGVLADNLQLSGNTLQAENTNGGIAIAATGTGAVYVTHGNFGISTTSPGQALVVAGNEQLTGGLFDGTNSEGSNGMILESTGSGTQWVATSTLGFTSGGGGAGGAATYGSSTLASTYSVTTSYADTGVSVTLPSPGTYLVQANARVANGGSANDYVLLRLYDDTTSTAIPNTITMTSYPTAGLQVTTPVGAYVTTVSNNEVISLQADMAAGTGGQVLGNNPSGGTDMTYLRVDNLATNGSTGAGVINTGTAGQAAFYASGGTTLTGTSTLFFNSGNIGIGTTTPGSVLDVYNSTTSASLTNIAHFAGAGTYVGLAIDAVKASGGGQPDLLFQKNGKTTFQLGSDYNDNGTKDFYIYDASNSAVRLYISPAGLVGIGTTTPGSILTVQGASEMFDNTSGSQLLSAEGSGDGSQYADLFLGQNTTGEGWYLSSRVGTTEPARSFSLFDYNGSAYQTALNVAMSGKTIIGLQTGSTIGASSSLDVIGNESVGSYAGTVAAPSNGLIVSGNVGIGTTSPGTALDVGGNITDESVKTCDSSSQALGTNSSGQLVCDSSLSDERLKNDITSLDGQDALNLIDSLNPVSFYWKDPTLPGTGSTQEQFGFIAQQVQQIAPNLVATTSPTYLTPDETYYLDYQGIIAPLVKAVQEQQIEIAGFEGYTASSTSASSASFVSTISQAVLSSLQSTGSWVMSQITATIGIFTTDVQTPRLETQTAAITDGLEMTDVDTGQVYCVQIKDGNFAKTLGSCGSVSTSTVSISSSTSSDTDNSGSDISNNINGNLNSGTDTSGSDTSGTQSSAGAGSSTDATSTITTVATTTEATSTVTSNASTTSQTGDTASSSVSIATTTDSTSVATSTTTSDASSTVISDDSSASSTGQTSSTPPSASSTPSATPPTTDNSDSSAPASSSTPAAPVVTPPPAPPAPTDTDASSTS